MKKRIVMGLFIGTVLTGYSGMTAYADLKTLMKVGKNQAAIAKALKKETKNYNSAKDAIVSGKLEEGMPADKIRKKCGEPIIEIYDKKKNAYKWLYMPAASSHFEGEKLYLFIDKEDELVGWKLVE
ncbi:MAG: hypothetical protein U9R52_02690 [Candidatus Omnitrophota bacterium]|nr:hypothetical protein [Candidatus Omnitrophota bacterium]